MSPLVSGYFSGVLVEQTVPFMWLCSASCAYFFFTLQYPEITLRERLCADHIANKFTCVFWEANGQRWLGDFLCKQIFLVEEEDYRRICEPLVVADRIKQLHALHHTVLKQKKEILLDATHIRHDKTNWNLGEMNTAKITSFSYCRS